VLAVFIIDDTGSLRRRGFFSAELKVVRVQLREKYVVVFVVRDAKSDETTSRLFAANIQMRLVQKGCTSRLQSDSGATAICVSSRDSSC